MSSRTQMRLQQLTGSLSSAVLASDTLNAPSLQEVMDHLASGIKRITGAPAYHAQEAGIFNHTLAQFTGSVGITVDVDVNGEARLASAKVEDLTAGRIVYASTGGELVDSSALAFDGTDLIAGSAKVSDLTETRVVYVGPSGALVDSSEMTFGAAGLTLAKDLSARSGSFSGNLTVGGNLEVQGALTYVDTTNLVVTDAKIVIANGATGIGLDGAGLYLSSDSSGENIRWSDGDDGKWIASDKFAADKLQALDLSSAIVWADASGNLAEVSAADFASYLAAGAGIDSVANGQIDATPYVAGTGVTITNFTASIGQPVATTDAVTFAAVTGSNLTVNRLMASNGSKGMVSADLAAWVAGTANQVIVTDDGDGSITLSAPQDIHSGASPEFLALNLAAYGDLVADGGNFKIAAADELLLSGADGQYQFAEAGDRASFASLFGASETVIGALNALKTSGNLAAKYVKRIATTVAIDTDVAFSGFNYSLVPSADRPLRIDVYVNGQLLMLDDTAGGKPGDYALGTGNGDIKFKFALEADDVATVIVR